MSGFVSLSVGIAAMAACRKSARNVMRDFARAGAEKQRSGDQAGALLFFHTAVTLRDRARGYEDRRQQLLREGGE